MKKLFILVLCLLYPLAVSAVTLDFTPYAGQIIKVIVPGCEDQPEPPPGNVQPIGSYRWGVSDVKPGKYYFIVKGPNKALTIGGQPYTYEKPYEGEELWYGTGRGDIRLVAQNGTIYVGNTGGSGGAPYQTKFHHTTTASSDGGKSLVMCPGQVPNFDKCNSNGVNIPYHGYDNGRVIYWNMREEPKGDIICTKDGKSYRYKADKTIVYGDC